MKLSTSWFCPLWTLPNHAILIASKQPLLRLFEPELLLEWIVLSITMIWFGGPCLTGKHLPLSSSSCLENPGGHLPFGKQLSWALWLNPGGH